MSSSEPVYRRVGRGGAGNWYSKKDVDEAEKTSQADIEAQKSTSTPATATDINPITASTQYTRAGRGGAGNFSDPAPNPDAEVVHQQEEQIEKIKAAVAAQKPRAGGMGGRGGVGNWSNSNSVSVEKQQEREVQIKVQEVEMKVLEAVEKGLAMPRPAHTRFDKGDGGE